MTSQDFLHEYVEEVTEHLQDLERSLLILERDGTTDEELSQIFRAAHSIKGASAYMGFEHLASLTHELESLISAIQIHSRPITHQGISILLECVDFISSAVRQIQETEAELPLPAELIAKVREALSDKERPSASEPQAPVPEEPETLSPKPEDSLKILIVPDAPSEEPLQENGDQDLESLFEIPGERDPLKPLDGAVPSEIIQEEDIELFTIFLTTFKEHLSEMRSTLTTSETPLLSTSEFEDLLMSLGRLTSSCQYMGYDPVVELLNEWESDIHAASPKRGSLLELFESNLLRLAKLIPGLKGSDEPTPAAIAEAPEEIIQEEDQELFSIYIDTFQQIISELASSVGAASDSFLSLSSSEEACETIRRLITSSQYMGYDRVIHLLQDWLDDLIAAQKGGPISKRQFIEEYSAYAERFQHLLPGLQLPGLDLAAEGPIAGAADHNSLEDFLNSVFGESLHAQEEGDEAPSETTLPIEDLQVFAPLNEYTEEINLPSSELKKAKRERITAHAEEVASSSATLRVDAQKVDQLLNQVGELVVTRSEFIQTTTSFRDMLRDLAAQGKLSKQELRKFRMLTFRLNESTLSLGRVANDLQTSVMRVRMLPISQLFQRFPRVIRDQALKLGKQVELFIEGGETEMDKRVLEHMQDPLVQFLRNAIAHGIESPVQRRQAGKPETGTIRLSASHEGEYVVMEIEDDGRGIDTQKLRNILIRRKVMGAREVERLTDHEVMYAIFLPGISTQDRVDGSAGRGVGLDVVKENVERMNGTVEVDSFPGQGTRFTIKIPLTVAIIRALLVTAGSQVFTLPLTSVTEILRYRREHTHTIEGFEVVNLRGKTIPLVHMDRLLGMDGSSAGDYRFTVIVSTSFQEVGLVVDALVGEREVVIKPIEDDLNTFDGFSGATILGDGTVSLILDVSSLLRIMKGSLVPQAAIADSSRR